MKTAVQWLVEELKSRSIDLSKWNNDLLEKAKEMEKQQITEAFDSDYDYWFTADNYYELTFKK